MFLQAKCLLPSDSWKPQLSSFKCFYPLFFLFFLAFPHESTPDGFSFVLLSSLSYLPDVYWVVRCAFSSIYALWCATLSLANKFKCGLFNAAKPSSGEKKNNFFGLGLCASSASVAFDKLWRQCHDLFFSASSILCVFGKCQKDILCNPKTFYLKPTANESHPFLIHDLPFLMQYFGVVHSIGHSCNDVFLSIFLYTEKQALDSTQTSVITFLFPCRYLLTLFGLFNFYILFVYLIAAFKSPYLMY